MNAKTDYSFTLLAAVVVAGVIATLVSPTRAISTTADAAVPAALVTAR